MLKYMLDTNIASFFIKGKFPALDKKMRLTPINQVCISMITRAELQYGVARLPEATRLNQEVQNFLKNVIVLDWDISASNHYGNIRASMEKKGEVIGSLDMLIASHAQSENLILITNNTREFERVEHLQLEDWTK